MGHRFKTLFIGIGAYIYHPILDDHGYIICLYVYKKILIDSIDGYGIMPLFAYWYGRLKLVLVFYLVWYRDINLF